MLYCVFISLSEFRWIILDVSSGFLLAPSISYQQFYSNQSAIAAQRLYKFSCYLFIAGFIVLRWQYRTIPIKFKKNIRLMDQCNDKLVEITIIRIKLVSNDWWSDLEFDTEQLKNALRWCTFCFFDISRKSHSVGSTTITKWSIRVICFALAISCWIRMARFK